MLKIIAEKLIFDAEISVKEAVAQLADLSGTNKTGVLKKIPQLRRFKGTVMFFADDEMPNKFHIHLFVDDKEKLDEIITISAAGGLNVEKHKKIKIKKQDIEWPQEHKDPLEEMEREVRRSQMGEI